jgi:hypothetical protein
MLHERDDLNGFENLEELTLEPREVFEQIEVNLDSVSDEQWLLMSKGLATEIFLPASASIVLDATVETLEEKILAAFKNDLLLRAIIAGMDKKDLEPRSTYKGYGIDELKSDTPAPQGEVKEV